VRCRTLSVLREQDIAWTILWDDDVAAVRRCKFSFISMHVDGGFAAEIFLEIAFLNSAKMLRGPLVPKAA